MTVYLWSKTADNNDDIDSTINYQEGQSPGSLNNSGRAVMAAIAKWRDDQSGMLNSGGTDTAYTVTTNQVYTALTDGITVTMRMHATNGASPTLAPDGLTAKAITTDGTTAVPTNGLVEGSIYKFTYDAGTDKWIVIGFDTLSQLSLITSVTGDEYVHIEQGGNSRRVALSTILHAASLIAIPIGTMLSWPTETAPFGFLVRAGAAISRTEYAALFAVIGTMYGAGDGSTTFNLPNHLGAFERAFANGSSNDPDRASRTNRGDGTTGDHVGTWQASQNLSHAHNYTDPGHTHSTYLDLSSATTTSSGPYTDYVRIRNRIGSTSAHTTGITILQNGGNQSNPVNYTTLPIIRAF